jgi:hypothetical protein
MWTLASMKGRVMPLAGAAMYFGLALLILLALTWWPDQAGRALTGSFIAIVVFFASCCGFLGLALLKALKGSPGWAKVFGIGGGVFTGTLAGFGGWKVALVFGLPLVIGLVALWRLKLLANPALENGRPQAGAAQRER